MGCDHGGRGRDVVEFGDYFRTQRWNQGPGADQPGLGKDLIKAKVAASIAHLYQRPRVWLEGFYGSGWGTTSAGVVDATFANFVMGFNLLGLPRHVLLDARRLVGMGAARQHLPHAVLEAPARLHGLRPAPQLPAQPGPSPLRCGHPVSGRADGSRHGRRESGADRVQHRRATLRARRSTSTSWTSSRWPAPKSSAKSSTSPARVYRVLVLPAMKAVRHSTLQKALEFHRAGGIVLALGALPEASDRVGRDDPEVAAMVKELFPDGPTKDVFARLPGRDYEGPGYIQHRKLGPRDLYAIYNAPKDTECSFRATGQVELWDPWTGATRPLAVTSQTADGTKLKLPLTEKEIQLIVFSPGKPEIASAPSAEPVEVINLDGDWEFELQPTSDNRFGDFHWPPTPTLIGAEVRQLWYCEGDNTNGPWRKVTCSFGPQFIQSATSAARRRRRRQALRVLVALGHRERSRPPRLPWLEGASA